MPWGSAAMVASVGAPASPKTSETAMTPMTAEIAGQRPDGLARRQRLGMKNAEVLGSLIVLAHGIGHAGAGIHAAQRGADQREEDGDGFCQHEVLAVALAQQRVADDDHHVADGSRRLPCAGHGIPGVERVVGREILEQVADQPLDQQRSDDGDGNMFGGVLSLASHRGHRFKSDQDQNGDRGLNEHVAESCAAKPPKPPRCE